MTGMHDAQDFERRLWNVAQGTPDAQLEQHIATCDTCQEELFTLRQLARFQSVANGGLADPPPSLLATVSSLMPRIRPDLVSRPQSVGDRLRVRLRQVTANLILDTGLTPQVAGLRGNGNRRTRQFAFVSEVADLDLEVSRLDDGYAVAGQLGMDTVPANLSIRFVPADQDPLVPEAPGVRETPLSEQGHFTLTLRGGEWVAAVEFDDAVVLFPGVQL
jgi:hypothetical protein